MKNVSVKNRLYVGFIIALLLVITVSVSSYFTFKKQALEAGWVAHTYQALNNITSLEQSLMEMETGIRGYRLTNDKKFLQPYEHELGQIEPSLAELKELTRDNPVQQQRLDVLESAVHTLMQYWESLIDIRNTDAAQLYTITSTEKQQLDVIRFQISKLISTERMLLIQRQSANQKSLAVATSVLIIGSLLVLLIVILLIYFIVKEFNNRRRVEAALHDNAEEQAVLIAESQEQNWLLTGVSVTNDALQIAASSHEVARKLLHALVQYLQLPAGAMYFYNEEQDNLQQVASYAVADTAKKTFRMGEGIVGTAAQNKQTIVQKNIPPGYWKVESGTGAVEANGEIVCLPLCVNDNLKGIIELGSFMPLNPMQLKLLKVITHNVAMAVHSRQGTERIQYLFEKVNEQKAELLNQQEELRQTNEQLTRQAEELQASEEELKVQEEELRQINVELEEKNESVENSRQELIMKARELEAAGKYKSEFLANMSHELRTPLNSVLILAKLLNENKDKNLTSKQVEYASIIYQSGNNLLDLINDILDLSKIEAGKIEFHMADTPVAAIKTAMQQLFEVVAEEKKIHFDIQITQDVPASIFTDKQRLEQVLKNLLSNAFKFTPSGGNISLHFSTTADYSQLLANQLLQSPRVLQIAVTDTGIGISEDKQQLIFEAFQQADGSTSRKYGGTGLGLSISKELVSKMGGEIRLESKEKQGSSFRLYLPLAQVTPVPATIDQPAETMPRPLPAKDFVLQTAIKDDRLNLTRDDKVILIIEDDARFATVLQDFARNKQYKTIVSLQGDEGWYTAKKYKPDAIILDLQLPVVNGWNLMSMLKADEALKDIPVHVISAFDEARLKNGHAESYSRKPVNKDDLEMAFEKIGHHIRAHYKNVLVLSGKFLNEAALNKITSASAFDVSCDYVRTVQEGLDKLNSGHYDCIVADIGKDVERGISQIKLLKDAVQHDSVPVIIYLDEDITVSDELKLKKVAEVVIVNSAQAEGRLMDELELFLNKIEKTAQPLPDARPFEPDRDLGLAKKKVLLVDDDMRNVFALSMAMEEHQMEVITASDGKEAIEKLKAGPGVDLVLMDLMMPEMDGYEAMRIIRQELKLEQLPVIALTAKAMTGDREKTIQAGASDYITKPVDTGKLFALMRIWLS